MLTLWRFGLSCDPAFGLFGTGHGCGTPYTAGTTTPSTPLVSLAKNRSCHKLLIILIDDLMMTCLWYLVYWCPSVRKISLYSDPAVWWHYMLEMAFYWSLFFSQFSDVKRKVELYSKPL